jgi:hypothetical protein
VRDVATGHRSICDLRGAGRARGGHLGGQVSGWDG